MKADQNRIHEHVPATGPSGSAAWNHHLGNWKVYAAAAGATLAMASKADADIVYSGPKDITASVSPTSWNRTDIATFTIEGYTESVTIEHQTLGGSRKFGFAGIGGGLLFMNGTSGVKKYAASETIKATGPLTSNPTLRSVDSFVKHGSFGPGNVSGFIGFKAPNDTLGWIRVKVSDLNTDGLPDEAEILGWAYNNTPGGPINAGQTMSAVPEPDSVGLALLAIGSAGLIAWRKRRKECHVK